MRETGSCAGVRFHSSNGEDNVMRRTFALAAAGTLTATALVGCGGKQDAAGHGHRRRGDLRGRPGHPDRHRHRQRDRRLLRARQRVRGTDRGGGRQGQGDGLRDRRLGAEHPAARGGQVRRGVLPGRHAPPTRSTAPAASRPSSRCRRWPGSTPTTPRSSCARRPASRTWPAMKGKRVSTGSPKSGTEVIANRVLTAAGLDPAKDIQAQKPRPDQDRRRHEGRLDRRAVLVRRPAHPGRHRPADHLGRPGRSSSTSPRCSRSCRRSTRSTRRAPSRRPPTRPRPTCRRSWCPTCCWSATTWTPNVACVLTKTLFDRKPQLEQANAAAKEISLDNARKTDPVAVAPRRRKGPGRPGRAEVGRSKSRDN